MHTGRAFRARHSAYRVLALRVEARVDIYIALDVNKVERQGCCGVGTTSTLMLLGRGCPCLL